MAKSKETTNKEVAVKTGKRVIIAPRITEKAARLSEGNAFTFNVAVDATKEEIKKAVAVLYGKTPVKVAVATRKQQMVFRRGRIGKEGAYKKAVVYLKKGETIDFI